MEYLFYLIVKSHIILLSIVLAFFIIEWATGAINFFGTLFKGKKNDREVHAVATAFTVLYFSFMSLMLVAEFFF